MANFGLCHYYIHWAILKKKTIVNNQMMERIRLVLFKIYVQVHPWHV